MNGRSLNSNPIFEAGYAFLFGTMHATEDCAVLLNPMADDFALAMWTDGSKCVDGTLKRVKSVFATGHRHYERFVVGISADFACSHYFVFLICH